MRQSAAKEAARLYDAAMQQQSLDAFLNPGWSGANGGLAPLSQLSGGPMPGASTQNSYRSELPFITRFVMMFAGWLSTACVGSAWALERSKCAVVTWTCLTSCPSHAPNQLAP